jgi:hypothetical protein
MAIHHSATVMKSLIGLVLLLPLCGGSMAAETYRWVDEKGVTNYGEKPPASRPARAVDTSPGAIIETTGQFDKQLPPDRALRPPAEAPMAIAPGPRGMEFSIFAQLQRGMTEGELLQRAGKPDHLSLETFDIQKTYYYFPTPGNPYTTAVTLRRGRISDIERIKKF